jgi:hypothetical protein
VKQRGGDPSKTGAYFTAQATMCLLCGSLAPMTTELGPAELRERARFHNDEATRLETRAASLERRRARSA